MDVTTRATVDQIAYSFPRGTHFGEERTVRVCGAHCVDREQVAQEFRDTDTPVERASGCLGGCALYGTLESGAYVEVPEQTATGIVPAVVAIQSRP